MFYEQKNARYDGRDYLHFSVMIQISQPPSPFCHIFLQKVEPPPPSMRVVIYECYQIGCPSID